MELIDKLVNNIPQPLIGQLEIDGALIRGINDVVEHFAIVLERFNAILVRWARLEHVEVALEVEL